MKLYRYEQDGKIHIGAQLEERLVSLPFASLQEMIQAGDVGIAVARNALKDGSGSSAITDVRLLAPLVPGKIFCSGLNYCSHIEENPKAKLLADPRFFVKVPDAVIGPGKPILHPGDEFQVDYEVELAVVIGKKSIRVNQHEALGCVFGYTILNDVSARFIQFKDGNEDMGKNFDSFAPLGPCVVTSDEIPDPSSLGLRLWLNGELMQDGTNGDWCFPLERLIEWLSMGITLQPGDLLSCGTPAGTGYFRSPQRFLRAGDVCRLEIDGIGVLENRVQDLGVGSLLERSVGK